MRFAAGEAVDPDEVDEESMDTAVELAEWFREETRRVYAKLAQSDQERRHTELTAWIRQKHQGDVSTRDLVTGRREITDVDQAERILNELLKAGLGDWYLVPTTDKGGAPTRRFRLAS